jgi:DNA-binding CsgD family transcriptional regulator
MVDDALERLAGTVDPLNTPVLYSVGARACADVAERARILGDDAEVERARERAAALLAELDRLLGGFRGCALTPAHRALCEAELARAHGQPSAELWHAAATAWLELEVPYAAAYAKWRAAEALLAGGTGRQAAAPDLTEAWETAMRLGAAPLRGEAEGLAHRARLRLHEPAAEAARADDDELPLGLTRRELDVLELISEGLTNRQIAQRLFISEKTAGVHVSHILAKLNVHNRLAAAGVAHQLGLSRPRSGP